jgi:hypothetical protein
MTHCEFNLVVHHCRSGRRLLSALRGTKWGMVQYVRTEEVPHAPPGGHFVGVATILGLTLSVGAISPAPILP